MESFGYDTQEKSTRRQARDYSEYANGIAYFAMDRQRDFSYLVGQLSSTNAETDGSLNLSSVSMVELWQQNIASLNDQIVTILTLLSTRINLYNNNNPNSKHISTDRVSDPTLF